MSASIQEDIETVLKTALVADTNILNGFDWATGSAVAKTTAFRAWLLDDEAGDAMEEKDFPCIRIVTSTPVPADGAGGVFHDTPVSVEIMTHHTHDPKRAELSRLYALVYPIVQGALTGFTFVASGRCIIEGGGPEIDENIQSMTIEATAKTCGLAA